MSTRFGYLAMAALLLLLPIVAAGADMSERANSSRMKSLINDNWRFQRGDPDSIDSAALRYDVLPDSGDHRDDKPADAKPLEAQKIDTTGQAVLKPWILPTGNWLINDAAKRFGRPASEPRVAVPCTLLEFDDTAWQAISLPHDWAIAGPFNRSEKGVGGGMGRLPVLGVGWYRRKLDIPLSDAGKRIFLDVDGAMSYASVWCNGHIVGGWPYGYSSWRVDLSPFIEYGKSNQLAIRLENLPDSSRWYPGAGIYRNVWITKTSPIHIAQWGTCVTASEVSEASATVELRATIDNESDQDATVDVTYTIYELNDSGLIAGQQVAQINVAAISLPRSKSTQAKNTVVIAKPKRWGPMPAQKPNRYVAVTTISQNEQTFDQYATRFGIRTVQFDPNRGILINDQPVKIQGVNQHHDLGALGTAWNQRAAERQLQMLREMGCNAIRMSHNPPAPELLELCDQMGFLVYDEAFDCWQSKKTPFDFHLIFPDWHEQDLRAMIRRDRNHPSVIIWSVGNEVGEQYSGADGAKVARRLVDIAHDEDPTRPVTAAMNFAKPDFPFSAQFDIISLNYQGEGIRDTPEYEGTNRIRTFPQYDAFHKQFPDKLILSSETASTLSTRGTYLFPVSDTINAPVRDNAGGDSKSRLVSSYELNSVDFGSTPDKVFKAQDQHPFVAGEFVWTGWDHLGEPTPYYSSRGSYCGIIDQAGFKKDRYYLYQSRWRPEFPMAHILPHWTWPERVGQVTPVHIFTSGDQAELFLNGKSLGRKSKSQFEYRIRFDDVVYQPGKLEVITYKAGKEWASDIVKTAGDPVRLEATADRDSIRADGNDLSFVTVRITDQDGVTSPRAGNRVRFSLEGQGEIVATDNGDPRDLDSFKSHDRAAFNGLCLAIVRAKPGQSGSIVLKVSTDGLQGANVLLKAVNK